MPLETGTYISDLVPSNPAHTDQLGQDDAHMRLVKATLKNTFPNINGALASTQAQIDAAVAATTGTGSTALLMAAATGLAVAGDTDTAIYSPGEDLLSLKTNGHDAIKVKADQSVEFTGNVSVDGNETVTGTLTATGGVIGPGTVPVGGTLIWWSDTLPASAAWGVYAFANGQAISRTGQGAALFALLGTAFGAGDGINTFNLPNLCESVPVGKSTMGGTAARGLITQFAAGTLTTLGNLFGEALHLLGIGEVPSHSHTITDPGHHHSFTQSGLAGGGSIASGSSWVVNGSAATTGTSTTGITATDNAGGGASHNNVQPSTVCNWIIRVA